MRKRIPLFCIVTFGVISSMVLAQDIQRGNHHPVLISHPDSHIRDSSSGWSNHIFKIKKVKSYKEARRGLLLNNGTVLFYFEETRPATKEEKIKRAQEFERKWKELEGIAKITLPRTEKELERAEEEIKKEVAKKPYLKPLFPFSAIIHEFFTELMKSGMEIAHIIEKKHILNQPVVVRAGFVFDFQGQRQKELLLNLEKTYGPESWQRLPNHAINIRASVDNRFVGIETEKGGIMLYELEDEAITSLGRVEGRHPFGFSPDGRHMYVTLKKKEGVFRILILPPLLKKGIRYFLPSFRPLKEIILDLKGPIMDVLLVDSYLLVLTWKELVVYDFYKERVIKRFKGGGRSMLLSPSQHVYVAEMDRTIAKIDLKEMKRHDLKINYFELLRNQRVYFHKLVSLSPDERYIAALYDPGLIPPRGVKRWSGSTTGESRLFIWDLEEKRVVWQMEKRLEDITGGFGYQSPAWFTQDWSYLLLSIKDNGLELWHLTFQGGDEL